MTHGKAEHAAGTERAPHTVSAFRCNSHSHAELEPLYNMPVQQLPLRPPPHMGLRYLKRRDHLAGEF